MMCRHEYLLPLLGVSLHPHWALVYPYMQNGSLDMHLTDAAHRKALPWQNRVSKLR